MPSLMPFQHIPARILTSLLTLWLISVAARPAVSQEDNTSKTVEQLASDVKPSLVTISTKGRDGKYQGVGTGFVIERGGLIATNLHVIGDSREFRIEDSSGEQLNVTGIHASDRVMDLALIRFVARDLVPLPLGDINSLAQGAPIIVMGNPHGLRNSVVAGVNSGIREFDGRKMM